MDEEYKINENVYYLIAGRLLWDPNFVEIIKENPEQAFNDTLLKGGISADERLLKALVAEYEKHEEKISSLSMGYFADIRPAVA